MVTDHEKAVKLFMTEANEGRDADIKAFASKTLPTLQEHLQMARQLAQQQGSMSQAR
jgi:putative membrane protein